MKKAALILSVLLLFSPLCAQDRRKYTELVNDAFSLFRNKEYLKSAQKYSEAFTVLGNRGTEDDRYNAACAWSLAGRPDSAFAQLSVVVNKLNYTNLAHIGSDTDLEPLHGDPRWSEMLNAVHANKEKAEEKLDKPMIAILDSIYREDQGYRMQLGTVDSKYGRESAEMKELLAKMNYADSINLIGVKKILDERGWLGADQVGRQGNLTLFLVIQHSDLETQLHYLPMMREAVGNGRAQASSLALLEDRIALRQGKRQVYGSQLGRDPESGKYYVLPLEDPANVDKRRAEVGLGKLQDYISNWGLIWNPEEYRKDLPRIEAMQKK